MNHSILKPPSNLRENAETITWRINRIISDLGIARDDIARLDILECTAMLNVAMQDTQSLIAAIRTTYNPEARA